MTDELPFLPYPPIEAHGVIGDRRTAALVAADGTIDWLCLPDYNGSTIFAALLDADRGGHWRMGPSTPILGSQRYLSDSAALVTSWETDAWELELTDALAWPQDDRPPDTREQRVLLRRLRCIRGETDGVLTIAPRRDFDREMDLSALADGSTLAVGAGSLRLWATCPLSIDERGARAERRMRAGEELWAVFSLGETAEQWSAARAEQVLTDTIAYWQGWISHLRYNGSRREQVRRSALSIHLLTFAPAGSLVAAPTTSLPERIGGDRNYDYRFAWVRDVSIAMGTLAILGDTRAAQSFMDWLVGLGSSTAAPLQVVYDIRGGTELDQRERNDLHGYRGSLPVRLGNHAFSQLQLDSLGFLTDCTLVYLQQGGDWRDEYWPMVRRAADFIAVNWQRPDSGIWELPVEQHFVSSKVMSWVTIQRAVGVAKRLGYRADARRWRSTMDEIHAEVMERGWSARLGAFRQHYDADTLDASVLLIPVTGFLPADHPKVSATVDRILDRLTIEGFVHRFVSGETPGHDDLPVGEFEGAFLPCTFWLAQTYARAGRFTEAQAILDKADTLAGSLGLFAEEVDARTGASLGNTPLLFSQVEYVKAVLIMERERQPLNRVLSILRRADRRLGRLLGLMR